jgi:hypothetical protein
MNRMPGNLGCRLQGDVVGHATPHLFALPRPIVPTGATKQSSKVSGGATFDHVLTAEAVSDLTSL